MNPVTCTTCGSPDLLTLDTYKRHWHCCRRCGTAVSAQKPAYPLSWLPYTALKKNSQLDEEKMYDYFVHQTHIDLSVREGQEFIGAYLKPANIDVAGKELLDISGGNGHFIHEVEKLGARITLTEINRKTIEYARRVHAYQVFEYDLNRHDLSSLIQRRFDVIFARACIMFARDLGKFVDQVRRSLAPGGFVMINHSVVPTLGVMLRTQLDEFSYYILRQPETIIDAFTKQGFELHHRADETDPSLYVYAHDLVRHWRWVYFLYEQRGITRLASDRRFAWPARDRRRSTLVFRQAS